VPRPPPPPLLLLLLVVVVPLVVVPLVQGGQAAAAAATAARWPRSCRLRACRCCLLHLLRVLPLGGCPRAPQRQLHHHRRALTSRLHSRRALPRQTRCSLPVAAHNPATQRPQHSEGRLGSCSCPGSRLQARL
jgi:hypothetical protein